MEIIPNTPGDFRRRDYWDAVFGSKNSIPLEWYGNYEDFAEIFDEYLLAGSRATTEDDANENISKNVSLLQKPDGDKVVTASGEAENTERQNLVEKTERSTRSASTRKSKTSDADNGSTERWPNSRILHVGCGDSELPERLTDHGCGRIVNVDFSSVVIERMKRRYRHLPNLSWECFDVRGGALEQRFGEETFDAVVDKGFFDALASHDVKKYQDADNEGEQRGLTESAAQSLKRLECDDDSSNVLPHEGGLQGGATEKATEDRESCKGQLTGKGKTEKSAHRDEMQEYLSSALKVLKTGGVFIIITLAQDYVVKELVRGFYSASVDIKIHPLALTAKAGLRHQRLLPFTFCVKKKHSSTPVRDLSSPCPDTRHGHNTEKKTAGLCATRCIMKTERGRAATEDVFLIWELQKKIRAVMNWRSLQSALRLPVPGRRMIITVHSSGVFSATARADDFPRYVVTVYDVEESRGQKEEHRYSRNTAAILAAPGEESCWLFATAEGNEELAKNAEARRVLVVFTGTETSSKQTVREGDSQPDAGQNDKLQRISEELSPYLADLALPDSGEIPIMMVGSSTTRVVAELACEHSDFAGWITVRDVEISRQEESVETRVSRPANSRKQTSRAKKREDHNAKALRKKGAQRALCRQLLFHCNPHTIQSEVKLATHAPGRGRADGYDNATFAFLQPVCGYHIPAAAAFALLKDAPEPRSEQTKSPDARRIPRISAIILGLGGGVLTMFLHSLLGEVLSLELTCVDIDPVVVDLARKFFGFREFPGRIQCVIDDATAYVKRLGSRTVHAIIVDINSGSPATALRCPAENFVREDTLTTMKEALVPGGLLVFNLLCRCVKTKNEVIRRLARIFSSVSSIPISEVRLLEDYGSACEGDKKDILECAARLLHCAKEWRVETCNDASSTSNP